MTFDEKPIYLNATSINSTEKVRPMSINERLTSEEYFEQYIKSEHYKDAIFDSKIIDNFLSDDELDVFEKAAASDDVYYVHDTSMETIALEKMGLTNYSTAHYYIFDKFYEKPEWQTLVDILQPKLEATFGKGIKASHIHVLDSRFPYGLHNDAEQPNMKIAPKPAWTLIIPFADYNSQTYVFNERSGHKDPWSWIHANNIKPNEPYAVDEETYNRDFYPFTGYDVLQYLTVESIYKWKRGTCFAADRYRYHCSDNYFNHGLKGKKAIILWTSIE